MEKLIKKIKKIW